MASSISGGKNSRQSLLQLYRQLLRACETYPSKKRYSIREAIREEWRDNKNLTQKDKLVQQIAVAYKGLEQLGQYSEHSMSGGAQHSPNWSVTLDQNPMPKPADYDEKKTREAEKTK